MQIGIWTSDLTLRSRLRSLIEQAGTDVVIAWEKNGMNENPFQNTRPCDMILAASSSQFKLFRRIEALRGKQGNIPSIVVVTEEDFFMPFLKDLISIGVVGNIPPKATADLLKKCIHLVAEQKFCFNPSIPFERILSLPQFPRVTLREKEVWMLFTGNNSARRVAEMLNRSVKTIEVHKLNLMRKLGVHKNAELVEMAADYSQSA